MQCAANEALGEQERSREWMDCFDVERNGAGGIYVGSKQPSRVIGAVYIGGGLTRSQRVEMRQNRSAGGELALSLVPCLDVVNNRGSGASLCVSYCMRSILCNQRRYTNEGHLGEGKNPKTGSRVENR